MTLDRLFLAWLVVAVWFVIATLLTTELVTRLAMPPGTPPHPAVPARILKWRLAEAALLTLIASLWFDSLGSGGWWLLFMLIGTLGALPIWFRPTELPTRALVADSVADVARYVIAGALLAWRLS